MSQKIWTDADALIEHQMIGDDPVMTSIVAANKAAGLPAIDVSPAQGRLLEVLVRTSGAKRILEIGTLGGYSTVWMARALPEDGRIVTMEMEPLHAATAKANFERAGVAGKIDLRLGAAIASLEALAAENPAPFDMIFIDADKPNNQPYIDYAHRLGRKGGLVICDNVIRNGDIVGASNSDPNVTGARDALATMGQRNRFVATAIQTVGSKGYDGFAIGVIA